MDLCTHPESRWLRCIRTGWVVVTRAATIATADRGADTTIAKRAVVTYVRTTMRKANTMIAVVDLKNTSLTKCRGPLEKGVLCLHI